MTSIRSVLLAVLTACVYLVSPVLYSPAQALECGTYNGFECSNSDYQFAGGFNPSNTRGGFGGGNCVATRTPVIFVHGATETALHWDIDPDGAPAGYTVPDKSVYDEFKARGYNDCELFGVTYLTLTQRIALNLVHHEYGKQSIIRDFIDAVKAYTGKSQVDIVGHSLGVSMSLSTMYRYNKWSSVRRFVNIAGAVRGIQSCLHLGYANPLYTTCGSMNVFNYNVFGLYPSLETCCASFGRNDWTSRFQWSRSMRWMPTTRPQVSYYTIHAGFQDQVMCTTVLGYGSCYETSIFRNSSAVKSQLFVGAGSLALQLDFDFTDFLIIAVQGGDTDGVGHLRARINTGKIIYEMLNTNCTGIDCAGDYNHGPVL